MIFQISSKGVSMFNTYALDWKTHVFVGKNVGIEHGDQFTISINHMMKIEKYAIEE